MVGAAWPRPAPVLGADTAHVLTEFLGVPEEKVRDLAARGIVGGPPAE